jgi:hypothetical protein
MQPKIVVIGSANIEKRALSYALIVQAERTGFEDSPLMGAWGCNEKRAFTARFSLKMAGRAGALLRATRMSRSSSYQVQVSKKPC